MSNDDLDNTISETFLDDLQAILDKNNSTFQSEADEVKAKAKTLLEEINAYKATNADKAIPIELVERMKDFCRKSYCILESINKYNDSIETILQKGTKLLEEDTRTAEDEEDASDFEAGEEDIEEEVEDLDDESASKGEVSAKRKKPSNDDDGDDNERPTPKEI